MLTEHDGENTRMKDEDLDEEMGRLECLGLIDGGLVCVDDQCLGLAALCRASPASTHIPSRGLRSEGGREGG